MPRKSSVAGALDVAVLRVRGSLLCVFFWVRAVFRQSGAQDYGLLRSGAVLQLYGASAFAIAIRAFHSLFAAWPVPLLNGDVS